MIMIGYPSYYFTNWYFYYPEHWHHYPHLGNTYVNHYYGPRRSVGGNSHIVHNWVRDNRNYLPKDFIANKQNRAEVIKQVGQLHMDAQKQQGGGGKVISPAARDQYFQKNFTKYPSLNTTYKPAIENAGKQNIQEIRQEPVKQPPVRINKPEQQPAANPRPTPSNENFNNINKAQEYHRNTWEQVQPTVRPQQQYQQPAPRPQQQQAPRLQQQQPMRQQAPAPRPSAPGRK
jgi:hypothetical protein